jgi:hypothetical protein
MKCFRAIIARLSIVLHMAGGSGGGPHLRRFNRVHSNARKTVMCKGCGETKEGQVKREIKE